MAGIRGLGGGVADDGGEGIDLHSGVGDLQQHHRVLTDEPAFRRLVFEVPNEKASLFEREPLPGFRVFALLHNFMDTPQKRKVTSARLLK